MLYLCGFEQVFDLDERLALYGRLLLGPFMDFISMTIVLVVTGSDTLSWLSQTGTDIMPRPGY